MVEGYGSLSSYFYAIKETTTYGAGTSTGTLTTPVGPQSGDIHIPFNPMVTFGWKLPEWDDVEETYLGDDQPTVTSIGWKEGELSMDMTYHAPFMLYNVFPTITIGAWDADGTATITGAMTSYLTTLRSMCIHSHIHDKANSENIDLNFFGCVVTEYSWKYEKGKPLKESITWRYVQTNTSVLAMNTAATYHNSRFAKWNDQRFDTNGNVVGIGRSLISLSTSALLDADIGAVESIDFKISLPRDMYATIGYDSAAYTVGNKAMRVDVTVKSRPKGNTFITDLLTKWQSRAIKNIKFQITDSSANSYLEYLQCTNMRLKDIGSPSLASANEEGSMVLDFKFQSDVSSVLTFYGKYKQTDVPIPTDYI